MLGRADEIRDRLTGCCWYANEFDCGLVEKSLAYQQHYCAEYSPKYSRIFGRFPSDPGAVQKRSSKVRKNLGIFTAETLHIWPKTRTMRRLLGPARVKACLPLIDIYTEL